MLRHHQRRPEYHLRIAVEFGGQTLEFDPADPAGRAQFRATGHLSSVGDCQCEGNGSTGPGPVAADRAAIPITDQQCDTADPAATGTGLTLPQSAGVQPNCAELRRSLWDSYAVNGCFAGAPRPGRHDGCGGAGSLEESSRTRCAR